MTNKQFKIRLCQLLSESTEANENEFISDVENLVHSFNTGIEFQTTLNL